MNYKRMIAISSLALLPYAQSNEVVEKKQTYISSEVSGLDKLVGKMFVGSMALQSICVIAYMCKHGYKKEKN